MKRSHMLLMLLCCLIPVAAIAAIYVFKVPLSNVLFYGLILLCPASHLLMMKFMKHDESADTAQTHAHHTAGPKGWPASDER